MNPFEANGLDNRFTSHPRGACAIGGYQHRVGDDSSADDRI
jgi:hypothetical protein